jgi:tRNA(Arg) A34 adenosine deaminase TadA
MLSVQRAREYATSRLPHARPYSSEEMFLRLLERGADAREAGNYGIAAAYVVRDAGIEVACFGQSTMFSAGDPRGHAEMNALRLAARLARGPELQTARILEDESLTLVRDAPHDRFETVLYSTLEPCPMCTVAILNSGVGRVVVGCADEAAGSILRLDTLAPLWGALAQQRGLEVEVVGVTRDEPVASELLELLRSLFFDSKEPLDEQLERAGTLPHRSVAATARAHRRVGA